MRVTENPETGVFVRTSNASGFFVQPDRGGGAVVTGAVSHARIHVFCDRQLFAILRHKRTFRPRQQSGRLRRGTTWCSKAR
jgi:hypothetical protein